MHARYATVLVVFWRRKLDLGLTPGRVSGIKNSAPNIFMMV